MYVLSVGKRAAWHPWQLGVAARVNGRLASVYSGPRPGYILGTRAWATLGLQRLPPHRSQRNLHRSNAQWANGREIVDGWTAGSGTGNPTPVCAYGHALSARPSVPRTRLRSVASQHDLTSMAAGTLD
ncbi:hypothetical protein J6590_008177 [Homalodisca vitripennis]|nr:hypothetical protein J6590_008177 [Homalodisca vitripennis]